MQLGGCADFYVLLFGVVYLSSCHFAMDRPKNGIKFCEDLEKSVTDTLAMIRQVLGEESISHTWKTKTHYD
jgi:hypothetical protein